MMAMRIDNIPFGTTDWTSVEATTHRGDTGVATWRTRQFGDIRVRLVDYSPGYVADHWCSKGHIIFCVDGEMTTDLQDGRSFRLAAGQSYQVADDDGAHRSHTDKGARLFIVD
jgi:quercetin dioxygenase-like cupin family protein